MKSSLIILPVVSIVASLILNGCHREETVDLRPRAPTTKMRWQPETANPADLPNRSGPDKQGPYTELAPDHTKDPSTPRETFLVEMLLPQQYSIRQNPFFIQHSMKMLDYYNHRADIQAAFEK